MARNPMMNEPVVLRVNPKFTAPAYWRAVKDITGIVPWQSPRVPASLRKLSCKSGYLSDPKLISTFIFHSLPERKNMMSCNGWASVGSRFVVLC